MVDVKSIKSNQCLDKYIKGIKEPISNIIIDNSNAKIIIGDLDQTHIIDFRFTDFEIKPFPPHLIVNLYISRHEIINDNCILLSGYLTIQSYNKEIYYPYHYQQSNKQFQGNTNILPKNILHQSLLSLLGNGESICYKGNLYFRGWFDSNTSIQYNIYFNCLVNQKNNYSQTINHIKSNSLVIANNQTYQSYSINEFQISNLCIYGSATKGNNILENLLGIISSSNHIRLDDTKEILLPNVIEEGDEFRYLLTKDYKINISLKIKKPSSGTKYLFYKIKNKYNHTIIYYKYFFYCNKWIKIVCIT